MGIYETIPADLDEVDAFGQALTKAHLRCRVWGHDPIPHNFTLVSDIEGHPTACYEAIMRCSHRCGVKWRVLMDSNYDLLVRSLDYSAATGYLSEKGRIDRRGRSVLRKHYFVRTYETTEET